MKAAECPYPFREVYDRHGDKHISKETIVRKFLSSHTPIIQLLDFAPSLQEEAPLDKGINELPLEIITEIFHFCCSIGVSRTHLMLVCKYWHAGMQAPKL